MGICALESMGLKLHLIRAPVSKTTNLGHGIKMFKPLLKECLLLEPCYWMDELVCSSGAFVHKFQYLTFFLISNFRHVLNVVCFLLGNSPASEFYMPSLTQSFWWAQSIFEPNIFLYRYPNILYPVILCTYPPMKMEQTECSETSAYKIQTPGNYPEESILHLTLCFLFGNNWVSI